MVSVTWWLQRTDTLFDRNQPGCSKGFECIVRKTVEEWQLLGLGFFWLHKFSVELLQSFSWLVIFAYILFAVKPMPLPIES